LSGAICNEKIRKDLIKIYLLLRIEKRLEKDNGKVRLLKTLKELYVR